VRLLLSRTMQVIHMCRLATCTLVICAFSVVALASADGFKRVSQSLPDGGHASFVEDMNGRLFVAIDSPSGAVFSVTENDASELDRGVIGGVTRTADGRVCYTRGCQVISFNPGMPGTSTSLTACFDGMRPGGRLWSDRQGTLWVEGARHALGADGRPRMTPLPPTEGADALPLAVDQCGNLWGLARSRSGGDLLSIIARTDPTAHTWTVPGDVAPGRWVDVIADAATFVWVAGPSGVMRLDPRKPEVGWKVFSATGAYPGGAVTAMCLSGDGRALVASACGELYELDFQRVGKEPDFMLEPIVRQIARRGLPGGEVQGMYCDSRGCLWAVVSGSLYRLAAPPDAWQHAWHSLAPLPYGNHDIFAENLNGRIYVPGGMAAHGFPGVFTNFDVMFVYDVRVDRWTSTSPMAVTRKCYAGVAALSGKIWVVGGGCDINGKRIPTDVVEIFDPVSETWTCGPRLDMPRMESVVVQSGGRIYVLGGGGPQGALRSAVSIGPGETLWRQETDVPSPVGQSSGCALDGTVYLMLGIGKKALIAYDTKTREWRTDLPPFPNNKPPRAAGVAAHRGEIWVMGGADTDEGCGTWRYSPSEKSWQPGPPLPHNMTWTSATSFDDRLYIIGGATYSSQHGYFIFWDHAYALR